MRGGIIHHQVDIFFGTAFQGVGRGVVVKYLSTTMQLQSLERCSKALLTHVIALGFCRYHITSVPF